MNHLSSFFARKYLAFGQESNIAFMVRICFLSIFIGTFALMLTLIITNGFEKVIHEKLQGINAPITITAAHQKLDGKAISEFIQKKLGSDITGISSGSIRQVIIDHNETQTVLFLKGVDPATVSSVSSIEQKITIPITKPQILKQLLTNNNIILGYKTAQSLNLMVGDSVTLLIPEPANNKKILLSKEKAIISGIFNVGLDEYDSNVIYSSLDFFHELFNENKQETIGVDTLFVAPQNNNNSIQTRLLNLLPFNFPDKTEQLVYKLRSLLPNLSINSWKELSPALVASLKLEKYVMFFILALISLVASLNMISLLFMQIQNKRRDIAILKSMGMPAKTINKIFLKIGLFITLAGAITGLSLAAALGYALENYPFIRIPDVYYVSYLPARVDPELFFLVFCATFLLGWAATYIPAKKAQCINITEVLRQD